MSDDPEAAALIVLHRPERTVVIKGALLAAIVVLSLSACASTPTLGSLAQQPSDKRAQRVCEGQDPGPGLSGNGVQLITSLDSNVGQVKPMVDPEWASKFADIGAQPDGEYVALCFLRQTGAVGPSRLVIVKDPKEGDSTDVGEW